MIKNDENKANLNELIEEVARERESIIKIRKAVEDVLQEDFIGIYDFFKELFEKNYTFMILMSRRCLVLCQIFMRFLILDNNLNNNVTRVFSDQAIPYYMVHLNDAKTVIVDDILIHGRTIRKLYRLIEEKCGGKKPDISVYMADVDIDCMSDEMKNEIRSSCIAYKSEWRSLSNRIVCSIFASNEPYTSFVTSYYKYGDRNLLDTLENDKSVEVINISGKMQEKYGLISKFVYEKIDDRWEIFRWLSEGEGIRTYWNENISKYTLIPYVFVRCMDIEDASRVFSQIEKSLPAYMSQIKKVLLCDEQDESIVEYKMRLLTCILSNAYWLDFKKRYQIEENIYIDVDTLNKSFGIKIAAELKQLNLEISRSILQLSGYLQSETMDDNEELSDVLEESIRVTHGKKVEEVLKNYFQNAWFIDECRALKMQERYKGLYLEKFLRRLVDCSFSKYNVLASMINVWDNGLATANYVFNIKKNKVGCSITPGEQSYKIILEKYPFLISKMVFISKIIRRNKVGDNISDDELTKYRIEILLNLVKKYHEKYELPDYDYLCKIIRFEEGYLNAWNQSAIIKNALQFDEHKDDKFIEEFIQSNL